MKVAPCRGATGPRGAAQRTERHRARDGAGAARGPEPAAKQGQAARRACSAAPRGCRAGVA